MLTCCQSISLKAVHTEQQVLNSPDCITATCQDPAAPQHGSIGPAPLNVYHKRKRPPKCVFLTSCVHSNNSMTAVGGGRERLIWHQTHGQTLCVCVCLCPCVCVELVAMVSKSDAHIRTLCIICTSFEPGVNDPSQSHEKT